MMRGAMHDDTLMAAFTEQAETFNTSAVAHSAPALDDLVALAGPQTSERWLDAACGPGIITRRLAPLVREARGIDLTEAMVDVARRESARAGLANATFAVGDATATGAAAASFDGAVTRFSVHHLPLPIRLVEELARVVRPGGAVVVADHVADEEAGAAAWSQEIERLRDPSHWACLTAAGLRALGARTGLTLEDERLAAIELDFDDWLRRGTADAATHALVQRALDERPEGTECFRVDGGVLRLRLWMGRWRRPAS